MRRGGDVGESGAFPVFEAVIVAVLILTTILFFTSLQRPTTATDQGGIDLGQLAADTLVVLQTRTFTSTACGLTDATLKEWVNLTMHGDSCTAGVIEDFVDEVLPPGTRFQVRLDNGVAAVTPVGVTAPSSLVLVPHGSTDEPRAAYAAETYIAPQWRMNWVDTATNTTLAAQLVHPGMEIPTSYATVLSFAQSSSTIECIEAPNGSALAPDGRTWLLHWQSPTSPWAAPWLEATKPQVPATAPFGVWTGHTSAVLDADGGCTGAASARLRVGLPDGTATDWAVYGLQLVVWFGA